MQWSHEFDLVACGFYLFVGFCRTLFLSSFLGFISFFCEALTCMLLILRNESKVYRGLFCGGFIYLFFGRFVLGGYLYIRSSWIFFSFFLAVYQQLLSLIIFWIPPEFFFLSSGSFCVGLLGAKIRCKGGRVVCLIITTCCAGLFFVLFLRVTWRDW